MVDQRPLEGYSLLKKIHFTSLVMKTKEIQGDLDTNLGWAKTPQEIDDKIATSIKQLVNFIADDEVLGKERFLSITDHLRPIVKPKATVVLNMNNSDT
jgi:hypothetical protein